MQRCWRWGRRTWRRRGRTAEAGRSRRRRPAMFAKARDQFRDGLDEVAGRDRVLRLLRRDRRPLGRPRRQRADPQAARRARQVEGQAPSRRCCWRSFTAITKRYAEAEAALREIIAKEPKNTEIQVRLANLLVNQNKIDDALKVLEANGEESRVARRKVEILLTSQPHGRGGQGAGRDPRAHAEQPGDAAAGRQRADRAGEVRRGRAAAEPRAGDRRRRTRRRTTSSACCG